jgi:uncharacterized membrane protein
MYRFIVFIAGIFILASCGAETLGSETPDEALIDTKTPTFSEVKLLLDLKCQTCHTKGKGKFAPSTTPEIAFNDAAVFKQKLNPIRNRIFFSPENPMPPMIGTPLTSKEKEGLKKYLDALEAQIGQNTPIETNLLWADVSPLLDTKCGVCHKPATLQSNVILDTLDNYKSRRRGVLDSILESTMPKGNAAGFQETAEGRKIVEWLKGGKDVFPQ